MQGHSAAALKTAGCYTELPEDPGQNFVETLRLIVSRMQCTGFWWHLCLFLSLLGRRFVSNSCKAVLVGCIKEYKSVKRACGLFLQSKT